MRRDSALPELLTVEEAAELLRVGRTKAYAMAKEWRGTGGLSGLPVIDLGDVLRVPLWRLEEMVGGELHGPSPIQVVTAGPAGAPEPSRPEPHQAGVGPGPTTQGRRRVLAPPSEARPLLAHPPPYRRRQQRPQHCRQRPSKHRLQLSQLPS